MKTRQSLTALLLSVVLGIGGLIWWSRQEPARALELSVPGMDRGADGLYEVPTETVTIGEHFSAGIETMTSLPGSWPQFRGPNRDNVSSAGHALADAWPESGPPVLWSVELGEGHAAPAVHRGRVYLLDYDEDEKADALRCLSLDDGRELWRRWYHVHIKRNHGMSRTVPAVSGRYVVTVGPLCHVMCVDAISGELKWGLDLGTALGTETPLWYAGQCPLIDDGTAVLAPAGREALLMGIDCETGDVRWQTPNPRGWKMSHASVMPMVIDGTRMYVYAALGGVVGVSAEAGDRGRILWDTPAWARSVVAPSPVYLGDGRILLTAGYGAGSMLLQVSKQGEAFAVDVLQEIETREGLASEQQTPLYHGGRLYAILPKDAGALRRQFVCGDPSDLTRIIWSSGKTRRFGLGPYMLADDKCFVLGDTGELSMLRLGDDGYQLLGQARVLEGHDAWGPIALAGTRMLLRDSQRMVCLELGADEL